MSDLEARVTRLEHEREILRTLHAYAHAIDYGDDEGWVDCFTANGVFDVRGARQYLFCGHDELRHFIARHTRAPAAWHKHLMVEPLVKLDGDSATCSSYFTLLRDAGGVPAVGAFGRYKDQLVAESDGRWRFAERVAEVEVWRDDLPPLVARTANGR
jgi:hypothetical protein